MAFLVFVGCVLSDLVFMFRYVASGRRFLWSCGFVFEAFVLASAVLLVGCLLRYEIFCLVVWYGF